MSSPLVDATVTRRRFLRQSFAFSALAMFGSMTGMAAPKASKPTSSEPGAQEFLMIGDWGYENYTGQAAVAAGMREYAQQNAVHPHALLFLGDNWYGPLEGGVTSDRWKTQFEDMYPASVFPVPVYAMLGNHDYQMFPESKVEAELEYAKVGRTADGPTRWTMPARWYRFDMPAKNPLVNFIVVDSNVPHLDGSTGQGRDFTLTQEQHTEQINWLEAELQKPRTAPHLIVLGHHPIYSDGPHGDHKVLIRDWDPLFRKYKVPMYCAGHDHDLQHLEFEGHPTSFCLSGGGGADLYNLKIEQSQRGPYAQKVYGFSHLSVTEKQVTVRHLDSNGKLLHAFTRSVDGKVQVVS